MVRKLVHEVVGEVVGGGWARWCGSGCPGRHRRNGCAGRYARECSRRQGSYAPVVIDRNSATFPQRYEFTTAATNTT